MKVFVAGATGALGKQLVPRLVAAGHEVTGMTRSPEKVETLRDLGARAAIADALDADAVARAVAEAEPEVVVHQLTALSASLDLRHFDRDFAQTNRLRTEGTDILLSAARAVGARRFVAQSFAGWPAERSGGPIKTEDDPLDSHPPAAVRDDARGDPLPRARGHERRPDRGHRAPLRGLLRAGDLAAARPARRRARRGDPRPEVPDRRQWGRRLVVRPHRGRRRGDGDRDRARRAGGLQRRRRRPRRGARLATQRRPASSARSGRCGCRAGSAGCWPARRRR